jgi:hypothetical protein
MLRDFEAGKPLTARHITQLTADARQRAQVTRQPLAIAANFIAGRSASTAMPLESGSDGKPYSLDNALDAFLAGKNIILTDEERYIVKSSIARQLVKAPPASLKQAFEEVRDGGRGLEFLTDPNIPGSTANKAQLIDMVDMGLSDTAPAFAARMLDGKQAWPSGGGITREALWQACFDEPVPSDVETSEADAFAESFRKRREADISAAVDAFISSADTSRPAITPLFREACARAASDPDNPVNLDLLDPSAFKETVTTAVRNAYAAAEAQGGRAPSPDAVREAVKSALDEEMTALQNVMKEIDELPAPPDLRHRSDEGAFTAAEKTLMKEAVQRHNLREPAVVSRLMYMAHGMAKDMRSLSTPLATPYLLAHTAGTMARHFTEGWGKLEATTRTDTSTAMRAMLEMAAGCAGISEDAAGKIAANLAGEVGRTVAGAFLMACADLQVSTQQRDNMRGVVTLMNDIRMTAATLSGADPENQPLFYEDARLRGLHEVPGGPDGCMSVLAEPAMGGSAVSLGAQALAWHDKPSFSEAEWNILLPIAEKAARAGVNESDAATRWIVAAGPDLVAAVRNNGGRPLSNAQIWQVVMGSPMPPGVTDADFGARMYADVFEKYREACSRLSPPVTNPMTLVLNLNLVSSQLVSPQVILGCFRPEGGVSLADCGCRIELSSMDRYGPETAYGLVTDFRRRNKSSAMTFENAQGDGHVIYPFAIADADNKPDNPDFQTIIGWARELTGGREEQTARVLQAFSQAGALNTSIFAQFFPGTGITEHGSVSVTAKAQPDGKVVVELVGDPASPIQFRQQLTIDTDGSQTCTAFDMRRKKNLIAD